MSNRLDTILELIDEEQLVTLLVDAVEQYSPSYAEEPAMQVFAERLNECGVRYMRQPLPPGSGPATDTRANLIIELGPQPSALMWVGHVDTVPLIDEEEQRMHRGARRATPRRRGGRKDRRFEAEGERHVLSGRVEVAAALHESGKHVAKVVIVQADAEMTMLVLPSSSRLN